MTNRTLKRFTPLDYLQQELRTQWTRLSYSWAVSRKKVECSFPPRKITIEASSGCNLRCIHCGHGEPGDGRPDRMTRPKRMMKMEVYKKTIDEAAMCSPKPRIIFALMGEPLLHKKLPEMVAYAHARGLWTQVNTNATLLTREKGQALIEAGLDMIYLSFDGVTKETYERIRVRSDFEKVLNHILDFIELKYEMNADGLTIHTGMTGEIINQFELDVFVREFTKLPVNAVYSPVLFNWIGEVDWAGENLEELQVRDRSEWPACNTSYDIIGIQADGNFIPCIYDFNGKYTSGNIETESVQELWNNERTQTFRQAVQSRDYSKIEEKGPMCTKCTILWNPRYNIDPRFLGNIKNVLLYTLIGFVDFCMTPIRRRRLRGKYEYFRKHRQEWRKNLDNQVAPIRGEMIEVVREQGYLKVRT